MYYISIYYFCIVLTLKRPINEVGADMHMTHEALQFGGYLDYYETNIVKGALKIT